MLDSLFDFVELSNVKHILNLIFHAVEGLSLFARCELIASFTCIARTALKHFIN